MILSWDESTITPKGVNFTAPPYITAPPYKTTTNWKPCGWIPQYNDIDDDVNKIKNFSYTYIRTHLSPLEMKHDKRGIFFGTWNTYTHNKRLAFPSIT